MKALILAGGFATRLRPLSCTRPKILFPIINKPLVEWILERLSQSDVREVIFAINSQTAFHLRRSKFSKHGIKIVYSCDPPKKPLGTGGPVKRAEKFLEGECFLVVNGDIFANLDYGEIIKAHRDKNATVTIALHHVKDPSRYGVAELAEDDRIKRFIEKPPAGASTSNLINAGIYVLSEEIFSYIPKGRKVSLEREIFPKLVEEGRLYGYVFKGLWRDIGKMEDYFELNKILLENLFKKGESTVKGGGEISPPAVCGKGSFFGEGSIIGPYTVLGHNVKVGKKVSIKNSIVFSNTFIKDSSTIDGAVIGENVVIGKRVKINANCVIGDYAVIGDDVTLEKGVSVCPAKEIFESVITSKCVF
ncbi:MAG: sugar phosphate nucleotidyltransferase [Candidatus Bathycorpusculaceae bacterium]